MDDLKFNWTTQRIKIKNLNLKLNNQKKKSNIINPIKSNMKIKINQIKLIN